jgi:hypothetical protein
LGAKRQEEKIRTKGGEALLVAEPLLNEAYENAE